MGGGGRKGGCEREGRKEKERRVQRASESSSTENQVYNVERDRQCYCREEQEKKKAIGRDAKKDSV